MAKVHVHLELALTTKRKRIKEMSVQKLTNWT